MANHDNPHGNPATPANPNGPGIPATPAIPPADPGQGPADRPNPGGGRTVG